jgi:hypothetical protein
MMNAVQSIDQTKVAELEKLTEQYVKSLDVKLMERIQALQQETYAPMQQATTDMAKAVNTVANPSGAAPIDQVYYLIAEEKDGHVARLILVYRQPTVERTVMQMSWDLRDYPSAWGEAL